MANITRRQGQQPMSREWDPSRALREWLGWDPFGEMAPMRGMGEDTFVPQFDVRETNDAFVFKADLPGVKENDLEIALTGNRLQISGRRESERREGEEGSRYYCYERSYGSFSRSFTLPEGIDPEQVKADLKDGELTLVVPKKPEVQPKRISIGAGRGSERQKAKA